MLSPLTDILTPAAETFYKIMYVDNNAAQGILARADDAQERALQARYLPREEGGGFMAGVRNAMRECYNLAVLARHGENTFENIDRRFYGPGEMNQRVMSVNNYVVAEMQNYIEENPEIVDRAGLTKANVDCLSWPVLQPRLSPPQVMPG